MSELGRALVFLAFVAACSGASGEPRATPSEESETSVEPVPEPTPAVQDERREPDPASTCGRALACCRAYVGAMPDVIEASACAGVFEASDAPDPDRRCRTMTTGWRRALERMQGEAPDGCR